MPRRANRKDGNEKEIRKHLQALGAMNLPTSDFGMSVDDIWFYRGTVFVMEYKIPSEIKKGRWRALTDGEKEYARRIYPFPFYVPSSQEEAQGILLDTPGFRDLCKVNPYDKARMREEFLNKLKK